MTVLLVQDLQQRPKSAPAHILLLPMLQCIDRRVGIFSVDFSTEKQAAKIFTDTPGPDAMQRRCHPLNRIQVCGPLIAHMQFFLI